MVGASLTWWTRVWVNSGSWWWTGRPGVLQSMGSQRVRHNWATELNWAPLSSLKGVVAIWRLLDLRYFSSFLSALEVWNCWWLWHHCLMKHQDAMDEYTGWEDENILEPAPKCSHIFFLVQSSLYMNGDPLGSRELIKLILETDSYTSLPAKRPFHPQWMDRQKTSVPDSNPPSTCLPKSL